MSPIDAPLSRAADAAVARVDPGGVSMPASRRLLSVKPLKVARVTKESGRLGLKKRRSWRTSRASLLTRRARMIATGQSNASLLYDQRQMDGPILLALSVLESEAGMN
jgi:hypothetical protein